jgi:amino acid permease
MVGSAMVALPYSF